MSGPLVTVRVSVEERERWNALAKRRGYRSLSAMIRSMMEKAEYLEEADALYAGVRGRVVGRLEQGDGAVAATVEGSASATSTHRPAESSSSFSPREAMQVARELKPPPVVAVRTVEEASSVLSSLLSRRDVEPYSKEMQSGRKNP